jgi:hypothetical protein
MSASTKMLDEEMSRCDGGVHAEVEVLERRRNLGRHGEAGPPQERRGRRSDGRGRRRSRGGGQGASAGVPRG